LDEDVRESACQDTHADVDDDEGAWQDAHERNGRGGGRAGCAVNPVLVIPWDPARGCPAGPAELPGYGLPGRHHRRQPGSQPGRDRDRRAGGGTEDEPGAGRAGCVRSRARRARLPAQPQAPPPGHGPEHPLHRPKSRSSGATSRILAEPPGRPPVPPPDQDHRGRH
jgi:hypothetical protein